MTDKKSAFDHHLEALIEDAKDFRADNPEIPAGAPLSEILTTEEQEKIGQWAISLLALEFAELGGNLKNAMPESRDLHLYTLEGWALRNAAKTLVYLRSIAVLRERLESRLAALEAQPTLKYVGVWAPETEYAVGTITTHRGSAWHANFQSKGVMPGDGVAWTLMVKKGRDSR